MMFEMDDKILSEDVFRAHFACDVSRCKGACCEAGDEGAPLSEEEVALLRSLLKDIIPFLSPESGRLMEAQGVALKGMEGEYVTPLMDDGLCAFAVRENNGIVRCGIEKAWEAGRTSFRKPLSCHLYPLRVKRSGNFHLISYHRWEICAPACDSGCRLQLPLFRFLKEPLERAFGKEFYKDLEEAYAYYLAHH